MSLKTILSELLRAVVDEAERNPEFARRIEEVLGLQEKPKKVSSSRPINRRSSAVLDPIEVARLGEATLRRRLQELNLEQLRDVVADYGMDPGKLVMKWKTRDRVVDRVVEISMGRVRKGEGFLSSAPPRSG